MSDEVYIIYRAKRLGIGLRDCTMLAIEFMRLVRRVDSEGDCTRKTSVRQRKAALVARP